MFENLVSPKRTGSGIGEMVYVALLSWFESLKSPTAPFLLAGDEVTIKDTHVLKAGKKFLRIQLAPQKNSYDANSSGDIGYARFNNEVKILVPGSYVEQHSLLKELLNKPLVALVKDSDCSMIYQIGSSCHPAYLTHQFNTGTTKEGNKGYNGTISSETSSVIIYAGGTTILSGARALVLGDDQNLLVDGDLFALLV